MIEAAAEDAQRTIDPEHFGALVPYARVALPDRFLAALSARRPDVDPLEIVPVGVDVLRRTLEGFVEQGFSKFVLVPVEPPESWAAELEALASTILPLQLAQA